MSEGEEQPPNPSPGLKWAPAPAEQPHSLSAQSLAPLASVEDPHVSVLDSSPSIGKSATVGGICAFVLVSLGVLWYLAPHAQALGPLEQQACFVALTMQVASLLQDLLAKEQLTATQRWLQRSVLTVKVLTTLTNFVLYAVPTPFVVDAVTGRSNCMLRWAEWTVLAFSMTFIVESVDCSNVRVALLSAVSQSLSTFCGLLLPLCSSIVTWLPTFALSFILYFFIFWRLASKRAAVAEKRASLPARCYELRRAELALALLWQCVITWTALVLAWLIDNAARNLCGMSFETDWAFVVDCAIDVVAKTLYSSVIRERSEAEPINFAREKQEVSDEQMRALWNESSDILLVSQKMPWGYISFASPSIATIVGGAKAKEWVRGRTHARAPGDDDDSIGGSPLEVPLTKAQAVALDDGSDDGVNITLPSSRGEPPISRLGGSEQLRFKGSDAGIDEMVSQAWRSRSFTCCIKPDAKDAKLHRARVLEVSSSIIEHHQLLSDGLVVVARDVTDRQRRIEARKHALSAAVSREKDEEANRFTRHEVKNCVLGALAQCDAIQREHTHAVSEGSICDPAYDSAFGVKLGEMRHSLRQTLDTVLSQAMAREVVHGIYVPRTAAAKVDDVLQAGNPSRGPCFPVRTTPPSLPTVDIDPYLLRHIHRNAVSNAVKYGRKGGLVATEIEVFDHCLVLRVTNEPGSNHERMCALDPEDIFQKGARFHEALPSVVLDSKGDGAWIMKKCADCLQGTCSYAFERPTSSSAGRTVFELKCPALERLDEADLEALSLGENVWGLGIDDCGFQRMILANIFRQAGLPKSRVEILGEQSAEMEHLDEWLVKLLRERLPPQMRVLAIVDENLELDDASVTISGSHAIARAREKLTRAEEARLLVLIRSANDSAHDVAMYRERAHGFLSKAPSEPDWKLIKRQYFHRFGVDRNPAVEETSFESDSIAEMSMKAASAELRKVVRLIDSVATMEWNEMWKWLHRIKGTVATVKAYFEGERRALADELIASIETLRAHTTMPSGMMGKYRLKWNELKRKLRKLMEDVGPSDSNPSSFESLPQ